MSGFPPVDEVLPQSGRMLLLGRVLAHDPAETVCEVDVLRSELFREADGRVPGWVAIEYMAQCIAAHGGLLARAQGAPPRPGLFLGSRRLRLPAEGFDADETLRVRARHVAGDSKLLAFECAVEAAPGGAPLAAGRLSVYILESLEALVQEFGDDR